MSLQTKLRGHMQETMWKRENLTMPSMQIQPKQSMTRMRVTPWTTTWRLLMTGYCNEFPGTASTTGANKSPSPGVPAGAKGIITFHQQPAVRPQKLFNTLPDIHHHFPGMMSGCLPIRIFHIMAARCHSPSNSLTQKAQKTERYTVGRAIGSCLRVNSNLLRIA